MDNADFMRHIILALIALIALAGLMSSGMSKGPAPFEMTSINENGDASLLATPSIAAFLNDSWMPSSFVAPSYSSAPQYTKKSPSNNTTNTTYAAYDFLNDTNATTNTSLAAYTVEGGSIYQFLKDNWTPSTPIEVITVDPLTKGKIN